MQEDDGLYANQAPAENEEEKEENRNQAETLIFAGKVRLLLPQDYRPWSLPEDVMNNPIFSSQIDLTTIAADSCFRDQRDKKTTLVGMTTDTDWQKGKLEERLGYYHVAFSRSLPLFNDHDMSFRELKSEEETVPGAFIGQMRYSFVTPDLDWFGVFLIFPLDGKETLINMTSTTEDSMHTMFDFQEISDSLAYHNSRL